jgi:hypothetical protein
MQGDVQLDLVDEIGGRAVVIEANWAGRIGFHRVLSGLIDGVATFVDTRVMRCFRHALCLDMSHTYAGLEVGGGHL